MPTDPYAILNALLRAEAVRNAPKRKPESRQGAEKQREDAPSRKHRDG
ncbi:hypothetical protein [Streptomyces sp. NPDC059786]